VLIDLNAELGRGLDEAWGELEAGFWPLLSSVAIPCGAHAGEPATMLATAAAAASRGLAVGAALGYRDAQGRGQRFVEDDPDSLAADLLYQLGGLDALVAGETGSLAFVRPSAALAEAVVANRSHAWAIVNAVLDFDPTLLVVGPALDRRPARAGRRGRGGAAATARTQRRRRFAHHRPRGGRRAGRRGGGEPARRAAPRLPDACRPHRRPCGAGGAGRGRLHDRPGRRPAGRGLARHSPAHGVALDLAAEVLNRTPVGRRPGGSARAGAAALF
jgi:hypothetical protein